MQRLTLALILLTIATGAFAQQPQTTDRRKLVREGQEVRQSLKITDAQKAKLKAIDNKYLPQIKKLRDAYQKEREAVYTPEQKRKMEAYREKLLKEYGLTPKPKDKR